LDAAERRLMEELRISASDIYDAFSFVYKAEFDNGLTEHEFDHVLIGKFNGESNFNVAEVAAIQYMDQQQIEDEIAHFPEKFTPWFKLIYQRVFETYLDKYKK